MLENILFLNRKGGKLILKNSRSPESTAIHCIFKNYFFKSVFAWKNILRVSQNDKHIFLQLHNFIWRYGEDCCPSKFFENSE